ncbi:MAG: hypothetical protein F9K40_10740 [Kofleriaceae bacterium]|nr:MAG: hypothetical protein F9K40_10740 [Kofleriaceae bacterium]MBZ0232779.1 hypothetical protein [Kofleriaceae bacterium]
MGQIARLVIFALACLFVILGFVLPWFQIGGSDGFPVELNATPFRGTSGLEVVLCDGCPTVGTGRLPGGLAWLAVYVALQLCVALVVSGVQVLRGHRQPNITAWTVISALVLGALVFGVLMTFDAPRGVDVDVSARAGLWLTLAACGLALAGHSRLLDRLDPVVAPVATVVAMPEPVRVERRSRLAPTLVRKADVGQAGMRITTEEGTTRLAWEDILRVQLITGVEPGVELTTRDALLRINRKSDVDYRFIPGGDSSNAADNLRRLYEFARERNPALRMTP